MKKLLSFTAVAAAAATLVACGGGGGGTAVTAVDSVKSGSDATSTALSAIDLTTVQRNSDMVAGAGGTADMVFNLVSDQGDTWHLVGSSTTGKYTILVNSTSYDVVDSDDPTNMTGFSITKDVVGDLIYWKGVPAASNTAASFELVEDTRTRTVMGKVQMPTYIPNPYGGTGMVYGTLVSRVTGTTREVGGSNDGSALAGEYVFVVPTRNTLGTMTRAPVGHMKLEANSQGGRGVSGKYCLGGYVDVANMAGSGLVSCIDGAGAAITQGVRDSGSNVDVITDVQRDIGIQRDTPQGQVPAGTVMPLKFSSFAGYTINFAQGKPFVQVQMGDYGPVLLGDYDYTENSVYGGGASRRGGFYAVKQRTLTAANVDGTTLECVDRSYASGRNSNRFTLSFANGQYTATMDNSVSGGPFTGTYSLNKMNTAISGNSDNLRDMKGALVLNIDPNNNPLRGGSFSPTVIPLSSSLWMFMSENHDLVHCMVKDPMKHFTP
jgi:hypothetical protein